MTDIAALKAAAFSEALTPSGDTKAAYIGEFSFPITLYLGDEEDTRYVDVPWTTIKEIMAAIRTRALSAIEKGEEA